ncbi:Lysine transporter LysE [uncultured Gammaproteobacteria bacterium]
MVYDRCETALAGNTSVLDELLVWAKGFALGVAIAAPVGPIGLLCIRKTLERGQIVGLATGLGAAVADGIFGFVAAFGVTTAISFLTGHEFYFRMVGGAFMLIIAYRTFNAKPIVPDEPPDGGTCAGGFITGLTLTLTNPITIIGSIGLFSSIGLGSNLGNFDAATAVFGVFSGSAAWWLTLSSGVAMTRHRFSEERVIMINHITAFALTVFGLWAVGTAASHWLGYYN